jgi:ribosomal protein L10
VKAKDCVAALYSVLKLPVPEFSGWSPAGKKLDIETVPNFSVKLPLRPGVKLMFVEVLNSKGFAVTRYSYS